MERKIIYLNECNLTFNEISHLKNYVWKSDKLIPAEMINKDTNESKTKKSCISIL